MSAPPSGARPEPVLNAAALAGGIAAFVVILGGLLRTLGVLATSDSDLEQLARQASDAVLGAAVLWATFGPWLVARFRARDKVTPLSDPISADGHPLVADVYGNVGGWGPADDIPRQRGPGVGDHAAPD